MNNYYDDRKESKQCRWKYSRSTSEVVCTKTNTQPNDFQHSKSSKNPKHISNKSGFSKKPDETGSFWSPPGKPDFGFRRKWRFERSSTIFLPIVSRNVRIAILKKHDDYPGQSFIPPWIVEEKNLKKLHVATWFFKFLWEKQASKSGKLHWDLSTSLVFFAYMFFPKKSVSKLKNPVS